MEKKKKKSIIKNNTLVEGNNENDLTAYNSISVPGVFGWDSVDSLARDIWSSNFYKLLEGDLIFSYRSSLQTDLKEGFQVTIVRHGSLNDFAVGMINPTYSVLLYHVPIEYLEDVLVEDLDRYIVDKKIIDIYKQIIGDIKNEITSN